MTSKPVPALHQAASCDSDSRSSSSSSNGDGIRTFGPRDVKNQFHIYEIKDEIRVLLAKVDKIHGRLQLDEGLLLDKGFCFGLLDPATNILINSAISQACCAATPTKQVCPAAPPAVERRRRRGGEQDLDLNKLDGLVAFLTCLFPYLPDAEAWLYLDAAEADPFVASLHVIGRRGMREFNFSSETTEAAVEAALRCAAVAAKHSDPQGLVQGWKLLSPAVEAFRSAPSQRRQHDDIVLRAEKLLKANGASDPVLQLKKTWELARRRHIEANAKFCAEPRELPPARAPMKRMLLAMIHGFYLEAMGRLPTAELRNQYHQSMIWGGYCYGLLDPVSNIIVNTIWCEQNFPQSKQFPLTMISTKLLWRIAAQSLYGLISFLCTRYRGLTPDLAMQRLLVAGADLRAADPRLSTTPSATGETRLNFSGCGQVLNIPDPSLTQCSAVEDSIPSASVPEAYTAAATAARHCHPLAHKEFLASLSGVSKPAEFDSEVSVDGLSESLSKVLHMRDGVPLSSQDLSLLCKILDRYPSSARQQRDLAPTKVKKGFYYQVGICSSRFWGQHNRVTSMATNALEKFNNIAAEGHLFELHIICAVNEFVSGPVPSEGENVRDYNPWTFQKYYHTHINFLAVSKARPYDPPTLFFAECGKHGADTCWCVPVIPQKPEAEQVRCIYCEYEGNRIVHPAVESFFGRNEFEKFYESGTSYTNDKLIEDHEIDVDWVHGVEDDGIYHHCYPDPDDIDDEELSIC
ncbi:uncharacterized protein LOC119338829 [Triticum dicoccoides]|uniref:uncharacterized protein LOC119338829 n=1 Tax=Triticum dicoccoides TaxID=85692 RepID=UPI0018917BD1|nr:uncharacterized protein LOC119338829 [Triticum dicoccoides]